MVTRNEQGLQPWRQQTPVQPVPHAAFWRSRWRPFFGQGQQIGCARSLALPWGQNATQSQVYQQLGDASDTDGCLHVHTHELQRGPRPWAWVAPPCSHPSAWLLLLDRLASGLGTHPWPRACMPCLAGFLPVFTGRLCPRPGEAWPPDEVRPSNLPVPFHLGLGLLGARTDPGAQCLQCPDLPVTVPFTASTHKPLPKRQPERPTEASRPHPTTGPVLGALGRVVQVAPLLGIVPGPKPRDSGSSCHRDNGEEAGLGTQAAQGVFL